MTDHPPAAAAAGHQQAPTQLPTAPQANPARARQARGTTSGRNRRQGKPSNLPKAQIPCRFYASKNEQNRSANVDSGDAAASDQPQEAIEEAAPEQKRQYQAPRVAASRVVTKPVTQSQVKNPRGYQIDQLKRRFKPVETAGEDETIYAFQLNPSDPDFPFELDGGLHCRLHVPTLFPTVAPRLHVTNKEMGRGFQVNIEKGFDSIFQSTPASTLLASLNTLDRRLELLLSGEKADTIKIVRNIAAKAEVVPELEAPPPSPPLEPVRPLYTGPRFSARQLADAEAKRKTDIRQLEARLGRMPLFEKAADGLAYMVPVEPRRKDELPVPLQNIKVVELAVPMLYPLEPCRIKIFGVPRESAEPAEVGFLQYVRGAQRGNLLGYINYLASSLHILAATSIEAEKESPHEPQNGGPSVGEDVTADISSLNISAPDRSSPDQSHDERRANDLESDERPHLHFIPRPPEWSMPANDGESESDSDYSSEEDDQHSDSEDGGEQTPGGPTDSGPERGVLLSFPGLELYGTELLELVSLAITVRCLRCKDTLDMDRIRNDTSRLESCKKCAHPFSIAYRREFMHTASIRAGHFDLDGCTVVDLLPSHFIPTCSNCSTAQPAPGIVSVRGENSSTICRECHSHMSFKIPQIKFLQVSASVPKNRPPVRRKIRENLGVTTGTELPNRGRCEHYRKSYRWFRFSCCSKVFACDRCHDAATDHPNEHANRMLCGWCSREQLYRPETCAFCRNPVIGKRAGGFWEGGKGTRDKTLMSRKDPRKWKKRASGMPPGHGLAKK